MVQLHQFIYQVTQIWCFGYHKIVENGSRPANMNNRHNTYLSYFGAWIWFSQRTFDVFICVNIGPYTPISISYDSGPVSCWLQNSRKWLKLHKYKELPKFFFAHIVNYGYHCLIYFILFCSVSTLFKLHKCPFHITQIQCLGDQKIVG